MPARSSIPKAERKRKSFPEDQGLSKVLALSLQAVDKKDAQFQKVLDKDHAKRESIARKKEETRKLSHVPSKISIMEQLREQRRERSRERKKKRRAAAEPEAAAQKSASRHVTRDETKPKKKRVSFG